VRRQGWTRRSISESEEKPGRDLEQETTGVSVSWRRKDTSPWVKRGGARLLAKWSTVEKEGKEGIGI